MQRPDIAAIILAAGGSSRFGGIKQTMDYDGEPLIRRAANAAFGTRANPIVVVVGANNAESGRALHGLDVEIILNESWKSGISSSLATGIRRVKESNAKAALITLADQPLVDTTALNRLIAAFDDDHTVIASSYASTIGVPAIFGREFFDDLENLEGDRGAGQWLRAHSHLVTSIPLPEAETDIDTPEDMNAIGNR
jgi:molybdenum cofactor cytidylyltransferase